MAKRMHKGGEMHGRMHKSNIGIGEDRSKTCNLPTEVMEREAGSIGGRPTGRYPDLYTGTSKQMTEDRAYFNSDLKPSKF